MGWERPEEGFGVQERHALAHHFFPLLPSVFIALHISFLIRSLHSLVQSFSIMYVNLARTPYGVFLAASKIGIATTFSLQSSIFYLLYMLSMW